MKADSAIWKLFQQLENLPITGVFVYTVPDSTQDCENDPNYDLDQVQDDSALSMTLSLSFRLTQNFSMLSSTRSLVAPFPSLVGLRFQVRMATCSASTPPSTTTPECTRWLKVIKNSRLKKKIRLAPALQLVWKHHARHQRSFMAFLKWQKGTTQRGTLTHITCFEMSRRLVQQYFIVEYIWNFLFG